VQSEDLVQNVPVVPHRVAAQCSDALVGDQPVDVAFVGDQLDVVPNQRTQRTFVSDDRHPGEPVAVRPPHLTQVQLVQALGPPTGLRTPPSGVEHLHFDPSRPRRSGRDLPPRASG
jgi:hypothetical protein